MQTETARIVALRRRAKRLGLRISKSRARHWHIDNKLGWRVIDARQNVVVDGADFDLDLDDVAGVLGRHEAQMKG